MKPGPKPRWRPCSIEGCERRHYALGWCEAHYQRVKRRGSPEDRRHPRYRGASTEREAAMHTPAYRAWRTAVFQRDDWTCQECGARGVKIHADHIKPWATFPDLRYQLTNGRTLCVPCHVATPSWGTGRCA